MNSTLSRLWLWAHGLINQPRDTISTHVLPSTTPCPIGLEYLSFLKRKIFIDKAKYLLMNNVYPDCRLPYRLLNHHNHFYFHNIWSFKTVRYACNQLDKHIAIQ